MNNSERFDELDRHIANGTLIRNSWTDGKERACLLAALSPEAATSQQASACPADVIPPWFASLTPNMDDNGTEEAWPYFVKRYASVVRRAAETLEAEGWRRAGYRTLSSIIREARSHVCSGQLKDLAAIDVVVKLCDRVVSGDDPTRSEWETAATANGATAARAAARVARAAARVARAAADAATWAAVGAVDAAVDAATWATAARTWVAADAAAESWDRLNTAILDAIELETESTVSDKQG